MHELLAAQSWTLYYVCNFSVSEAGHHACSPAAPLNGIEARVAQTVSEAYAWNPSAIVLTHDNLAIGKVTGPVGRL
jgi:hypothetical protein